MEFRTQGNPISCKPSYTTSEDVIVSWPDENATNYNVTLWQIYPYTFAGDMGDLWTVEEPLINFGKLDEGTYKIEITPKTVVESSGGLPYVVVGTTSTLYFSVGLTDNYPIIILPGVMGSRLFSDEDCTDLIWAPRTLGEVSGIGPQMRMDSDVYIRPCENQNDPVVTREYGAIDDYKLLVDFLCHKFPDRQVYFFSYDFRQSNSMAAEDLEDFVNSLNADKVDIVCHSMGGIVASLYAKNNPDLNKINRIVTLGTPYCGSPMIYKCTMTNIVIDSKDEDKVIDDSIGNIGLALLGRLDSETKQSFPSVAELLPNEGYISQNNFYYDYWEWFQEYSTVLPLNGYRNINSVLYTNYSAALTMQNQINDGEAILLNSDKSYFAIGINKPTISSVHFSESNNSYFLNGYEPCNGDGTVPYLSSTMLLKLSELGAERYREYEVTHGDLTKKGLPLYWVASIISGTNDANYTNPTKKSFIGIKIECPVDAMISIGDSILSSDPNNLITSSDFGELYFAGENNDKKIFFLQDSDDYKIEIKGTDNGTMDYSIRYYDENSEIIDERTFNDVPITGQTEIITDSDNNGAISLSIDNDSDGQEDTSWIADGPNSIGFELPQITIDEYQTTPTNLDITVFASVDKGTLNAPSHKFTENDSFEFVATDSEGHTVSKIVTITNIDKVMPIITINDYVKNPTNKDIMVTASTNEGMLNVNSHIFSENGSFNFVATDEAGNVTTQTVTITNIDKVAPVFTLNGNTIIQVEVDGYYNDEGAILNDNYDESRTVMGSGSINYNMLGDYILTYTAADEAGNEAIPTVRTIRVVDTTAPVISLNGLSSISVKLGSVYMDQGAAAYDNYDEVVTSRIVTDNQVNTAKIGTYSVIYNVSDANGNAAVQVRRIVIVVYDFSGYRQPIDSGANVINTVKAGRAIPVKFSLNGNQGLNIFSTGSPTSITASFSSSGLVFDAIEESSTSTAGGSTLHYDAGTDQYTYVWKTDKSWTGYRVFIIKFVDGTTYAANFKFSK